jgi:hypothetical protein
VDGRIAFDVYASLKDPHCRVDYHANADRVEVMFGRPSICDEPANILNLWLTHPHTVIDLGIELIKAGQQFLLDSEKAANEVAAKRTGLTNSVSVAGSHG